MTPALAVALGAPVAKKYSSPRKMDRTKEERWEKTKSNGDVGAREDLS